jgi:WD40 repeat protein
MMCLAVLDEGQQRTIRSLQWSPCGRYIASVSFDATCAIWELQSNAQDGDSGGGGGGDDGGAVSGFEMEWELAAQLEGHENEVKGVCWSSDGGLLATCGRDKR